LCLIKTRHTHRMNNFGREGPPGGEIRFSPMIHFLRHLIGWLFGTFRSRQDLILENMAPRQQLMVLHTKRPRRRLSTVDGTRRVFNLECDVKMLHWRKSPGWSFCGPHTSQLCSGTFRWACNNVTCHEIGPHGIFADHTLHAATSDILCQGTSFSMHPSRCAFEQ